jgi:DNA polymerase III subunit epsilon
MGLLSRLLGSAPRLGPELTDRLQRLSELSPPPTRNSHRRSRYVTVDVETTGLDMRRDRVLSIGAVSVESGTIDLSHCFEVVLRQPETSSRDNILVHRIGGQRQLGGEDPSESLMRFLEYVGHCPLVAFRADFDRTMIDRALKETLGTVGQSAWLDLAELLPALYPSNENKTMDEWLASMGIRMLTRHDALADALATAQMLQVCLHQAETLEMSCPAHLLEMQRAQHWLGKR